MERPILVTGAHRSGTTWVGRMLSLPASVVYLHEPFNLSSASSPRLSVDHWFTYVTRSNEETYYEQMKRIVKLQYPLHHALSQASGLRSALGEVKKCLQYASYRLRGCTPLLKDPIAFFSAGWLAERFGARVVLMVRHPAAFVGSLKHRDWAFPFDHFLAQPLLLQDHLSLFVEEIERLASREHDIVEQACLLWKIIYATAQDYRRKHPDWVFLRHADVARAPLEQFRKLFARLDLPFTDEVEVEIKRHSAPTTPWRSSRPVRSVAIARQ